MSYENIIKTAEKYGCEFKQDVSMKDYVTMKVGGKAKLLVNVNSRECLCELIKTAKSNDLKYYVLGNGSNVIVEDKGIDGVVILLSNEFSNIVINGDYIECEAGASLLKVCLKALEHSLSGLEFAYGIPGTVGGAVYMNAGAYGGEISQIIENCTYLDSDGEIKTVDAKDMNLSYRHSMFTDTDKVILSAVFKLNKADKTQIKELMDKNLTARKTKQPLEYPSSGSTFKRPDGSYASKLIEECGLKGLTVGGAQVSQKHSGFVINTGNATTEDILNLVALIKQEVYEKTGFVLEEEIKII